MTAHLIHTAETLGVGSIEQFVTAGEIAELLRLMDPLLAEPGAERFGERRTESIHEIPGHTATEAMDFYEPAGRVEIPTIPADAELILQRAFERAHGAVKRLMPSITACRPWTYVEYGPGQHITPHLDGIAPDPFAWPRQISGISIVISRPHAGGEFFVESTSDERLWSQQCHNETTGYVPGTWLAHDGADSSSDWFKSMPRTRWSVDPAPGTALLYGSQLAHGTEPVVQGRGRKFISWLVAERS
jgi:hypothetical protein